MQKQIDEVMGLVNEVQKNRVCAEMSPSNKEHFNYLADKAFVAISDKLRELLPVWQPMESAERPEIGANGFGERVLLCVDCGDGTLKSTKIGWWCDRWMLDTGGSVKENGYRAVAWMTLPKAPE